MTADPAATPFTDPDDVTVAIPGVRERHATGKPVIELPDASFADALACVVFPIASVDVPSETETVVTVGAGGGVTVTVAAPVFVETFAWIEAVPGATAVTSPLVETVAIEGESDVHVID